MRRKWTGRHGAITLFLCIILSALIVLETVFVAGSYRRKQEVELTEATSHQVEQIMSQFDRDALNWYGIYGIGEVKADHAIFERMTCDLTDTSFEYQLTDEVDEEDIETSVMDYMKLRGFAFEGDMILDRINTSLSFIESMDEFSSVSEWMPTFQEYLSKKDDFSFTGIAFRLSCELSGLGDYLDSFDEFSDSVADMWERDSSASLQAGDSSALVSMFDPSGLQSVTSMFDKYLDADTPNLLDRFLLNEYASYSFDSRVKTYETDDGQEEESNIVGTPFSDMHDGQKCDLEYLLIGSDSESTNKFLSFDLILVTRLLLDFGAFLMDDEKMAVAMGIAEVMSILIAVLSLGFVIVDPTVIQYTIIFMMAFIQAVMDSTDLISGKSVTLFYNDSVSDTLGDFSDTWYRDYYRVFLLFVPKDKLLSRMNQIIRRDCGTLYTGVSAQGYLRGDGYQVERRFELYESRDET